MGIRPGLTIEMTAMEGPGELIPGEIVSGSGLLMFPSIKWLRWSQGSSCCSRRGTSFGETDRKTLGRIWGGASQACFHKRPASTLLLLGVFHGGVEHEVTGRIASQSPRSLPSRGSSAVQLGISQVPLCGQEGCPNFIERCPEHRQE